MRAKVAKRGTVPPCTRELSASKKQNSTAVAWQQQTGQQQEFLSELQESFVIVITGKLHLFVVQGSGHSNNFHREISFLAPGNCKSRARECKSEKKGGKQTALDFGFD
jgi:hypothetical protein